MSTPQSASNSVRPRILPLRSRHLVQTPTVEEYRELMEGRDRLRAHSGRLIVRQVYHEFFSRAMMDKGALLTFLSILTFAPTMVGAYSIATLILANNSEWTTQLVTQLIQDFVPEELQEPALNMVLGIIAQTADQVWVLVLSILVALFSSSGYVRAFARNANSLYGREEGRHPLVTILFMWGLTAIVIVGGVLLAATLLLNERVVMGVLDPITEPLGLEDEVAWLAGAVMPVWSWLRIPVALFLGVTVVDVLYNFTPNVRYPRFRVVTAGSLFAVIASALIYFGYSLYLQVFIGFSAASVVGGVIATLIALWLFNIVMMIGLKIDVEITRARELAAGLPSERTVMVPPRSERAAVGMRNDERRLVRLGLDVAEQHAREEA